MSLIDVVRAVTKHPAAAIGLDNAGFGHLTPGDPAYVTIFEEHDGEFVMEDSGGDTRTAAHWVETKGVVVGHDYHERTQPL